MDHELLREFLDDAGELVDALIPQLIALENAPEDTQLLNAVFRSIHSIKGGAGFLLLEPVVALCHRAEDVFNLLRQGEAQATPELIDVMLRVADALASMFTTLQESASLPPADMELLAALDELLVHPPGSGSATDSGHGTKINSTPDDDEALEALLDSLHRAGPSGSGRRLSSSSRPVSEFGPIRSGHPGAEASVRVEAVRLDGMMNLVGELVLLRNRLMTLVERDDGSEDLVKTVSNLDAVTDGLQSAVMHVRMQPISRIFSRFPRVVRDVARTLGKEISLVIHGGDSEVDKNLVERLSDPLIHLVRNAVDHGIESPEEREAAGKPPTGEVTLEAYRQGHYIVIRVGDDGRGMDPGQLRARAVEKGALSAEAASALSDAEALQLILGAGFSTRSEVSNISGRGVGMDVVRARISELRGLVEIESTPGEGTWIRIMVPLTRGIFRTLMVWVGSQRFALPMGEVVETIATDELASQWVQGRQVVIVRGEPLPLVPLGCLFAERPRPTPGSEELPPGTHVVVVTLGGRRIAMLVDALIGEEEVVVKPLTGALRSVETFVGATVTSGGDTALIVDTGGVTQTFEHAA